MKPTNEDLLAVERELIKAGRADLAMREAEKRWRATPTKADVFAYRLQRYERLAWTAAALLIVLCLYLSGDYSPLP